jgi:ATP-dependent Lon protease
MAKKEITIKDNNVIPLLPLRGLVVFPNAILHFDVGREMSVKSLEEAMLTDQKIFLVAQKDSKIDEPGVNDVYDIGCIVKVKQLLKLPGDTIRVLVEGRERARAIEFIKLTPNFIVKIDKPEETINGTTKIELEAVMRRLKSSFEEYAKLSNKISPETMLTGIAMDNPGELADLIAANMHIKTEQKQAILEEFNIFKRLELVLEALLSEIEILEIERNINTKVRSQIDKMQREYYLREQMKAIQNELGEKDGLDNEIDEYREKIAKAKPPEELQEKAEKEIKRLLKMPQSSAEASVIRTYLDLIIDLPWNKKSKEVIDLDKASEILEQDHYGLDKIKERVIEYLAVRKMKSTIKGPILCFAGPPGTGKTSIARSIARAINRKYVRMSLGGVKDEAEIRGHRRTYVGAMPGRIISAVKQAGTKNPLILLDEIDKMSNDFRGDPASAMLEVLDSEQNFEFRDHYLEFPYDLSDVLFLTTANNKATIPAPLLDRMEIIDLSGYTEEEKVHIAMKYLVKKQIKANGLTAAKIKFDEQAIRDIINYYTREAGVRNLEREIATVCRKAAKELITENKKSIKINSKVVSRFLGIKKFRYEKANEKDEVGIAKGLAWTPFGGDTLNIEVNVMDGKGNIELTGQLGDVMKESAKAGLSFIRSRVDELSIDKDFYKKYDIHIHVPEGATPKDGPSAGITMVTAMVSALTGIPVKKTVAMTGEVTLRGRVLPIGGLKEKVLAARRAGIETIIAPEENKKDLEDIPENVSDKLKSYFVNKVDEVLALALSKPIERRIKTEKVPDKKAVKENTEENKPATIKM